MEFGTGSEFHPCSCIGGNPLNGTLPFSVSLTASLDVDNIQFWGLKEESLNRFFGHSYLIHQLFAQP